MHEQLIMDAPGRDLLDLWLAVAAVGQAVRSKVLPSPRIHQQQSASYLIHHPLPRHMLDHHRRHRPLSYLSVQRDLHHHIARLHASADHTQTAAHKHAAECQLDAQEHRL